MENKKELLLQMHEKYNKIFDLQKKLPAARQKYRFQDIEDEIINNSRILILEIDDLESELRNDAELLNIIDGCNLLILDPYKRLGGRINLK